MERRRILKIFLSLAALQQSVNGQTLRYSRVEQQRFMRRAAELRQQAIDAGDQAYGAVIVKDGQIVGEGPSRVIISKDPTAHAEMEAIRDAAKRQGTRDLRGCEMYSTSRPCKMCETAAYWAGLSRMYSGADMNDAGPPRYPSC